MIVIKEENCHFLKAWEACASLRSSAKQTYAFSGNGSYLVVGTAGKFIDPISQLQARIPELADGFAKILTDRGWENLPFNAAADKLQILVDRVFAPHPNICAQMELILVQNKLGIVGEADFPLAKAEPKNHKFV